MTKADPQPPLAELEDRVRDGDTTITAADLAAAREAEHLASLHQVAENRAQERAQLDRDVSRAKKLRDGIDKLMTSDTVRARKAYAAAVAAVVELQAATTELAEKRNTIGGEINSLGLSPGGTGDMAAERQRRREDLHMNGVDLQLMDRRIIGLGTDYVALAQREAAGETLTPHALSSDEQVAEHRERQQRIADEQAAREAEFAKNHEVVVDHGLGNYIRRIEV
ncbi:hypothetical protein [Gordonia sp. SL306]|uniref:hypothetical protein n=1 Tax=Gordonia sp. SL306 TaxID=2995145 RepID=UPI00226EAAFF|nr:hypothetical protein [Gordonia sp. SL306]WAC54264.1 hypothetical protein OVA31_16425 [Gordonia sp. SL306]